MWKEFKVAADGSHHLAADGTPAYAERFDQVLKYHPPGLAPVSRGRESWHVDENGLPAYSRRFFRTFGFYEQRAAVVDADGWHHIAPDGSDAYAQRYGWCGNFQGGMCAVRDVDGAYLHIDADGNVSYPQRWRYAGDYRDGIAVVQADNGRSTHIDREGRLLHGKWFIDLDVYHKGFARARDEDGWTHVTSDGTPAYSRRFAAVEPFYNGQARVERFDGALEVIDEAGTMLIELRAPLRSEFSALSGDMVGFWKTRTIATAVELGLVEALPGSASEIATRCGLHPDRTRRILRALGELRLTEQQEDIWLLTPRGSYLRADHPLTLADAAIEYGGPLSAMWEQLPQALRADGAWRNPDIFSEVARDERRRDGHHRMLRSYARHDYPQVVSALGLQGNERIVDAAGGLGCLAGLMFKANPALQITVLDRPEVVAQGRMAQDQISGLRWQAGDIFAPWGVEAEAVILARVLHDWDDEAACRILRHARAALPRGGRLFIIEMLIPQGGFSGALCDLHLLMATGGRERSVFEFERLLKESGFALEAVRTIQALPSVLVGVAK